MNTLFLHNALWQDCQRTNYIAFSSDQMKSSSKWRPRVGMRLIPTWRLPSRLPPRLPSRLFLYAPNFLFITIFALPLLEISRGSAKLGYILVFESNRSRCLKQSSFVLVDVYLKGRIPRVYLLQTVSQCFPPSAYTSLILSIAQLSVEAEVGFKIAHRFASDRLPQPQRWQEPYSLAIRLLSWHVISRSHLGSPKSVQLIRYWNLWVTFLKLSSKY